MTTIVIGAGIAGLAAARALKSRGMPVTLLEARNTIGGRIRTDHTLGIPLSLGPQWIHGRDGNPLIELAHLAHAKHEETHFSGNLTSSLQIFGAKNQPMPHDYSLHLFTNIDAIVNQCKHYALQQPHDLAFMTALNAIHRTQPTPYADALYEQTLNFIRLYFNADPHFFSARYGDEEERFPGEDNFMLDGFMPICNWLAKDLDIQLNTTVSAISSTDTHITISTNQKTYTADTVIVTVPLGVLKKNLIQFDPPLPEQHSQAIHKLKMGIHDTLALKFPTVFWPKEPCGFSFLNPDADFKFILNLNLNYQQPILACKIGADRAEALESEPDDVWVSKAMQQFRTVFGNNVPEPSDYVLTRWGIDPYTYGSYSYIPVGATGNEYQHLSSPIANKIFFAGEATHQQFPATVHGAYLSGLRAAKAIA